MSKLDKYKLQLVRRKLNDGEIVADTIIQNVNGYSTIYFITGLSEHETKSFINDLEDCIDSKGNIDEGYFSDSVEHMNIWYQYPNVNLDDILILPMEDLKEILEEWLRFNFGYP